MRKGKKKRKKGRENCPGYGNKYMLRKASSMTVSTENFVITNSTRDDLVQFTDTAEHRRRSEWPWEEKCPSELESLQLGEMMET